MSNRYDYPPLSLIWSDQKKFEYFLQVEVCLLEALESENIIPHTSKAYKNVQINLDRIQELELKTHHDVVAFCTSITEQVDPSFGKFFHYGCTSSDIIDTALSLQMRDSLTLIYPLVSKVIVVLKDLAVKYQDLPCVGRSHGIHAEIMSFGQKWLSHAIEFSKRLEELKHFEKNLTGQFSGAVGNYTVLTPEVEKIALDKLKLKVEPVSTQVIPRDVHAKISSILSLLSCAIERVCLEIRHLHRTEVDEVSEGFQKGQKGSSTMPHKKNPISTENLTGISRLIRTYQSVSYDNTQLWHERDISHSSTERIYLPQQFILSGYALNRLSQTLENLVIHEKNISDKTDNIKIHSSYVLHQLLKNWNDSRESLYEIIQDCFFKSENQKQLQELLLTNIPQLAAQINDIFPLGPNDYLKNTKKIFKRVIESL